MTATLTAGTTDKQRRDALAQVRRTGRAYTVAQDRAEAAMVKVRAALAHAALAGVPVTELARTAGMSRNAVYRALGQRD